MKSAQFLSALILGAAALAGSADAADVSKTTAQPAKEAAAPADKASAPAGKDMSKNASNDRSKHYHPRDGK